MGGDVNIVPARFYIDDNKGNGGVVICAIDAVGMSRKDINDIRKFVFESKEKNILKEFFAFISSRLLTLLLDMGTMFVLSTLLQVNYNISKIDQ